jgi:hypothetical protein
LLEGETVFIFLVLELVPDISGEGLAQERFSAFGVGREFLNVLGVLKVGADLLTVAVS